MGAPLQAIPPAGIAHGVSCLLFGFRFVYSEHRELWRIAIWPTLLAVLLLSAGWVLFGLYVDNWVAWIWPEPEPDSGWGILSYLWKSLVFVVWIVLAFGFGFLITSLFTLLAAPFSDLLSERVEGIMGTWEPRPFSLRFLLQDLAETLMLELTRLGIKIVWLLPLFIVSFLVPVVGQGIYMILGGYLLSKFLGMDYVDWCAARRGWSWKQRFQFAKNNRAAIVGFGAGVFLFLMIPLAFVFVWPAAVAGGAKLFTSLQQESSPNSPNTSIIA